MNCLIEQIAGARLRKGTAMLWWLGQMGLMVRLGDMLLCVDYYAQESNRRQTPPPVPAGEVARVDAFLGTHDHSDHIDHGSWRVWAKTCPEARFVFPEAHRQSVLDDGIEDVRCVGLNDGESFCIGDVTVTALAAAHEFLDLDPVSGLYPCLQYIIEGDGLRIYHAGDTLRYEGMLPRLKEFGTIDAALLPINGRDGARYRRGCIGNMTFQEAADLAGGLRPRLVIPGHWDMFADNPGDPEAFKDYLEAKYGDLVRCVVPSVAEPIVISAGEKPI